MTSQAIDPLTAEAVRAALTARHLGTTVLVRRSAPSTMETLSEMAMQGAPDGAVVIADFQSAGRGRLGRSWVAPAGTALLMSVLLRPHLPPARVGQVQMAFALAIAEALDECLVEAAPGRSPGRPSDDETEIRHVGVPEVRHGSVPEVRHGSVPDAPLAMLKWPNDVLVRGDKIAGLLSEAGWRGESARVVVGIGVNVHQSARQMPSGATSLAALGAAQPPAALSLRARLAAAILNQADAHYDRLLRGESLVDSWASRLETIGQRVQAGPLAGRSTQVADGAEDAADRVLGTAIGVSPSGALRVRTDGGDVVTVRAGDVTLVRDGASKCGPSRKPGGE